MKYLFLFILFLQSIDALEQLPLKDVDLGRLLAETQGRSVRNGKTMVTILLGKRFWEVSLAKNTTVDAETRAQILNYFSNKVMIGIAISPTGGIGFDSPESFYDKIVVDNTSGDGIGNKLLLCKDIDAMRMVGNFGGVLRSQFGEMGNALHIAVYAPSNPDGTIFDELLAGKVIIRCGELSAEYIGPFDCLFKSRIISGGRPAAASWKYDPWTGVKIAE